MASPPKLIVSTERDEEFEKARHEVLRANAYKAYQAFEKEVIEIAGKANGLGSSRWARGEQKNYKVTPGGPKNLDFDDNSLCRNTPSLSSKMSVPTNENDIASKLLKLGGLDSSRYAPKLNGNTRNRLNTQGSSRENVPRVCATVLTPSKGKSKTSSLSRSSQSFAPRSLEASPSSGGGVSLVSSPTAVVKSITAKKPTPEKLFEQMLLADYQKRMGKVQPTTATEAGTNGNNNVSVASQEPSNVSKANSMIEKKSDNVPVVTKTGGSARSETNSSTGSSQAISAVPSTMKKNVFLEMLAKAQTEKHPKQASIPASSILAASMSGSSIPAYIPALPLPISRNASDAGSEPHNLTDPSQPVISGPSMMKENEFMAMLIKGKQEKDLKRTSIVEPPLIIKKDPKGTYNFQNTLPWVFRANEPFHSEYPTNTTTMSNKPLIPAPINKWTTAKLTQGKALCKADEDFQTFLANKTAVPADAARTQQQTVLKPLSPKTTPRKPTQTEACAEKRKLAAGQAEFDALLTRRFANTPTSPPAKLPINKTNTQDSAPKSDVEVFAIPEATMQNAQAILLELKTAINDGVTNVPIIKKENFINTNSVDENVISALNTVDDTPVNTTGKLAVLKGESSQDKISHVAVHSFTPNENENVIHADTQVNNPFNDKLMTKKQAGSLVSSPPFWSISSFSDIGDKMGNTVVDPKFKEGVRVTATQDANVVLGDWDGSWCAPPIWEERGSFDAAYIPSYIQEWSAAVSPQRPVTVTVDTSAEGFISGEDLVNNVILSKAPKHEPTIPDTLRSTNELKRLNQTSGQDAMALTKKYEKAQKAREHSIIADNAHQQALLAMEPAPNPYAPKIEIYLRPATEADAKQILQIYNHYITESYIPEDQEPLTESDILFTIEITKKDKHPFVVAVKGRIPAQSANPKVKTKIPQYENVIGFGYTEMRGCGIAGKPTGRSRYTHNMHFYVHHDYTRKGVGGCILDRLLQVSSRAWAGHEGYDWLNHNNDPAYDHGGGSRCHQMMIELPVLRKNDPNYKWKTDFLRKFWFIEEFRLKSVGRTSITQRAGEWLDIVHYQFETEHEAEFTPFV
ncbi:hypothetical protein SBOR_6625 [Sclerotinia borealis F-4128]|uniref:N-acetyltransferase domain-containing protein n=1 Tax=Sclerotinia borealis (strain F-4128) TaxID=1432307 RepID=W9CDX7_SCLBF|nr:hypothetical protein SBOR_6625 [Sclerotinia borealis F-4128]